MTGRTTISGRDVTLQVGLPSNFPYDLPVVRLDHARTFPHTPHVELDGTVCFMVPRGLVIDRHHPLAILHDVYARAVATLHDGWTTDPADEFMDEFGAYWQQTFPRFHVQSFLHVDDRLRAVSLTLAPQRIRRNRSQQGHSVEQDWHHRQAQAQEARRALISGPAPRRPARALGWVADDAAEPEAFTHQTQASGRRHALYIPLRPDARLQPPRPGERWSAAEIRTLIREHLTDENLRHLDELVKPRGDTLLLIMALPRPRGGVTLIGLRYLHLKGRHPLAPPGPDDGPWEEPEPVTVQRLDRPLVTARGGGRTTLSAKRVLLVGCGAVGGHLATMLATAGVGHLTLLDHDLVAPENVFRHVLGRAALGRRKVEALAADLRNRVPYLTVRAVPLTLDGAVKSGEIDLGAYDLVISATGEPAVDLDLNARLRQTNAPRAIFTWLEPFGIGGHALLSTGDEGCFECLYSPDIAGDTNTFHNRAALYAKTQPRDFNLDEIGCGSFYTPFSDLDARRTAELAVRLAVDTLEGRLNDSIIRSWKGDPGAFLNAGYVLAERFSQDADQLLSGGPYAAQWCRTCGTP
ncbi:ThiF family adenylyltransferase [Deinococcus sp. 6GRE01]|uniref:ThiF family adenylyltransferase n=1 Tax=Deinococcus sp. 6GRE01 TaxID=2745873 RepID=UPI001E55E271|nr:ThiF family adenylyltransferase [Deinococcus sp. 6GRE01]